MSRKPLVLLGAGASKPAGIPTAPELTSKILQSCVGENKFRYAKAINALAHMLKISGNLNMGPECADIESIMNAAQFLANRFNLEFAPFVGAWHTVIEEIERQQLSASEVIRIAQEAASAGANSVASTDSRRRPRQEFEEGLRTALEHSLERLQKHLSYKPDGSQFHRLSHYLSGKLMKYTWKEDVNNLEYLAPLIEQGRNGKVTVATLNYDNCVERKAADLGIQCSNGLTHPKAGEVGGWLVDGVLPEINDGIDLIKLHGSITWLWHRPKENEAGFELRVINEIDDKTMTGILDEQEEAVGRQLAIIFGGHNKLTAEGPFLDLFVKFKLELSKHSELLVIGYSFRDPHINQAIVRWLDSNSDRKIFVIDPKPQNECLFFRLLRDEPMLNRCSYDQTGAAEGISKHFGR